MLASKYPSEVRAERGTDILESIDVKDTRTIGSRKLCNFDIAQRAADAGCRDLPNLISRNKSQTVMGRQHDAVEEV